MQFRMNGQDACYQPSHTCEFNLISHYHFCLPGILFSPLNAGIPCVFMWVTITDAIVQNQYFRTQILSQTESKWKSLFISRIDEIRFGKHVSELFEFWREKIIHSKRISRLHFLFLSFKGLITETTLPKSLRMQRSANCVLKGK